MSVYNILRVYRAELVLKDSAKEDFEEKKILLQETDGYLMNQEEFTENCIYLKQYMNYSLAMEMLSRICDAQGQNFCYLISER